MHRLLPIWMGLALAVGVSAAQDTNPAPDTYKDKQQTKVENNGDVKIKDKSTGVTGKHKVKTKVKHHGDEVKVKETNK